MDERTIQPDRVYTLEQTAAILQVSLVTARRWAAEGRLPSVKVGRRHHILGRELIKMLTPTRGPAPDAAGGAREDAAL
jgi:excisionase family DNA binding protein